MAETGSAGAFEAAAVAVADAAMGAAMEGTRDETNRATMAVIGARSRASAGLRLRVPLPRLLHERRNQAGLSLDRRQGISRYCFPENRSRNTAE